MTLTPIDTKALSLQNRPTTKSIGAKAMEFGDALGAVSAMTPFATEFTRQATGSVNAATVLNAAFASFPAAASALSGGGGGGGYPSWSSASYSSPYGPAGTYPGGIPGLDMRSQYAGPATGPSLSSGNNQVVPGTNLTQFQLMEVMNQNNLQLIELQAMMQSNMQVWNTKSNILSADHRAKMSMIEKFTARG
ncbi:MAG: hypothetical protein A3F82_02700 [Deltaproteobacteria bacterium RIFCSPLOWO2_12_FULL_44_12]|nr:MAG: hypothetical protein A2712_10845 [Deltaproteobacteria bacterium RIFCSPHIGHO2_01_FULL_43_49]OGQ16551.1 MAG: hypothetical protein A3D22_06545 [Deltaproteobacteria bacterium RIFCSPHIGHO2_02_FULL_44_53]OGQ32439.1 MAG: hypothetical protein A2979_10810 [Deltaproteobacteria bacterium RIFCSPLOWO2_01_FULL_45_74]OGQ41564.1 MAG: hypothetical protein A3I70_05155 [Deltaproteobacteria bacterium RIFCSPLOWO2_02_FULL_44_34]OGQ69497.1 MAG: hypothetical protein A3F82_02700 [Deltaproteobacteria bacterium R